MNLLKSHIPEFNVKGLLIFYSCFMYNFLYYYSL